MNWLRLFVYSYAANKSIHDAENVWHEIDGDSDIDA